MGQLEEHRQEECVLTDKAVRELLDIALDDTGDVHARTKVEAWNALRARSEWRGKLLGLPAPQQVNVTHIAETDFDRAFDELVQAVRAH